MVSIEAWIAVAVIAGVFFLLALGRHPAHLILLGGLALVLVTGIVQPARALAGFANPGLITVGALFVVVAGLRQTGALTFLVHRALGRPRTASQARRRLVLPVVGGSAFLNNTPLVAMLMPVVTDWARTIRVPPSKLLLPLSYLAILGGLCTLIGTSTNLVISGLILEQGLPGPGLFEITRVGLPCAVVGTIYLLLAARRFLPDQGPAPTASADPREYTIEMTVAPGGPLAGRAIGAAGLRHLPGVYLMEIHRRGNILPVVNPTEKLEGGDQLVFVGVVDSVVDLQRIPGLQVAREQVFKLSSPRSERCFAEAVVSRTCPILGRTIRDAGFRNRYNAVVIAVSRGGERVAGRIGDIELRPGDMLLLEALPSFIEQQRNQRDFYLVSRVDRSGPPTDSRAPLALLILAGMIALAASGLLTMLQASFAAAGAMILTRCCSEETAMKSLDWPLLLAVAASFSLGAALETTGAANQVAGLVLAQADSNPWLALALIYATTTLLTELVTNNAAAVIMFPIALSSAEQLGANPMPFFMALMISASASFATPLGYQTNLMVYGPGGYRLRDFLKMGLPMDLLLGAVAVALVPWFWPF